jgi:uncharacterized protein YqhQ
MQKSAKNAQEAQPSCEHKTTIGGQALIEGLMMIGPETRALAVRLPDGSIKLEKSSLDKVDGPASWLFVRGCVRLFRQLVSGTRALLRSAELADEPAPAHEEEEKEAEADKPGQNRKKSRLAEAWQGFWQKHDELILYGSVILGLLFSVGLFMLLPNLITSLVRQWIGLGNILSNLLEGLIRISLFILYLALANRMADMRRVWMYHGAEHKAIACYEARLPLTVENVRKFSRFHARCGTAFLFLVIIISIIIFSLTGWWGRWLNLLIRFALVPLVAAIAYEIIRLSGRYDNKLTRAISRPGLWLQRLTTAEPDDSMLEVAITALEAVRPQTLASDRW